MLYSVADTELVEKSAQSKSMSQYDRICTLKKRGNL